MQLAYRLFLTISVSLICLASPAFGYLNLDYSFFYEGEFSDNIRKTATRAPKEYLSTIGSRLNLSSESVRYQALANYEFTYLDYLYDSSDDEFQISGNLFASFEMIEDILSWDIDHSQQNLITDSREADNPDNRERRSTLSTGPVLNLLLNPTGVDILTVSTRYTETNFENTEDADSERDTVIMNWRHLVSRLTSFSLNAQYSDVSFDTGTNDYESFRYSVGVERIMKQGNFSFNVGFNEIIPQESGQSDNDEDSGSFVNASLQNQWGRHSLDLSARRELTDSSFGLTTVGSGADNVESDMESVLESMDRNVIVQDIVDRQNVTILYGHTFNVDTFSLQLSWDDEDYQFESADQASILFRGTYNLAVANQSTLTFTVGTEITDFKEDENLDENITYTLGSSYGYAITRELSLQLGINYERRVTERLSNGSNLASPQYYEETTAGFTVNYRPL